jgi:hypothetical protein
MPKNVRNKRNNAALQLRMLMLPFYPVLIDVPLVSEAI